MLHKFGKFVYLIFAGAILITVPAVSDAQGTDSVSASTAEVKQVAQPVPATSEVKTVPAAQPDSVVAAASSTTAPVSVDKATTAVSVEPAKSSLTARDFLLKQEELSYGVTLTQKASKPNYPYKENPVIYEEKNERQAVVARLFPEENLKNLNNVLNAIAITIMSYKKDEKEQDFGLVAIEFNEASKAEFDNYRTLIKASILTFFKEDNFIMVEKFPMIVLAAHNHPDKKKDDIKWVADLIQKKISK